MRAKTGQPLLREHIPKLGSRGAASQRMIPWTCKQLCRRWLSLHLWSMAVELNWKKHSLKNLMTSYWLLKLKIKVKTCSKLPMTEEVENWNVNESFMTNPSYSSFSKCRQELAISSLGQNVLPGLLLFFSFLPSPLDTSFLYLKCSGS